MITNDGGGFLIFEFNFFLHFFSNLFIYLGRNEY